MNAAQSELFVRATEALDQLVQVDLPDLLDSEGTTDEEVRLVAHFAGWLATVRQDLSLLVTVGYARAAVNAAAQAKA